jgi:putative methionine-R-sulfoxide reductase with GAF domain
MPQEEAAEPKSGRQKAMALVTAGRWPLLIFLPGVVATFGGFAGLKTGQTRVYFVLVTIFCALILAFLNVWKEIQARRSALSAASATAALADALNQAGKPLVTVLGNVAESTGEARRADVKALATLTLQVAVARCGRLGSRRGKVRSVIYRFDGQDRLVRVDWYGRQGKAPRPEFDATSGKGDRDVVEAAQGEDFVLCRDIDRDPPANMEKKDGRSYKSFIQVPIRTDRRSFGFLSVDSDEPYSLTSSDVGYVILMARLLASAYVLEEGISAGPGVSPAVRNNLPTQPSGGTNVAPTP